MPVPNSITPSDPPDIDVAHRPRMPESRSTQKLLQAVQKGDEEALAALFESVYAELRPIAHNQRRRVNGNMTLKTTEVVHEVFLKFQRSEGEFDWDSRIHFLRVAAQAMRQIIIDYARRRSAEKRGGDKQPLSLNDTLFNDGVINISEERADVLVALDEAIEQLGQRSPRQRSVVECRFFAGMTIEETAAVLDISTATVNRDWRTARTWLYKAVKQILSV
jgi:RNA polymerase sigma factor (TIGR02999 family)